MSNEELAIGKMIKGAPAGTIKFSKQEDPASWSGSGEDWKLDSWNKTENHFRENMRNWFNWGQFDRVENRINKGIPDLYLIMDDRYKTPRWIELKVVRVNRNLTNISTTKIQTDTYQAQWHRRHNAAIRDPFTQGSLVVARWQSLDRFTVWFGHDFDKLVDLPAQEASYWGFNMDQAGFKEGFPKIFNGIFPKEKK